MKIFKFIVALIATLGVMACFDAIMNFVLKDNTNLFWIISTNIGRVTVGWFFGVELFKYIGNKLEE